MPGTFTNSGIKRPISIVNAPTVRAQLDSDTTSGTKILSGALTADTYKAILSITGSGIINFLGYFSVDTTERTMTIRITLDGTVVYTHSIASVTVAKCGIVPVGRTDGTYIVGIDSIPFDSSLVVDIKSDLSETDKVYINTIYQLT